METSYEASFNDCQKVKSSQKVNNMAQSWQATETFEDLRPSSNQGVVQYREVTRPHIRDYELCLTKKNTNRAKIQIFALLTALRNLQIVTRRPDVSLRDKLPLVLFSSSIFWELLWYIVDTAAKSRLPKMDGSDEYGGRYPR